MPTPLDCKLSNSVTNWTYGPLDSIAITSFGHFWVLFSLYFSKEVCDNRILCVPQNESPPMHRSAQRSGLYYEDTNWEERKKERTKERTRSSRWVAHCASPFISSALFDQPILPLLVISSLSLFLFRSLILPCICVTNFIQWCLALLLLLLRVLIVRLIFNLQKRHFLTPKTREEGSVNSLI